MECLPRSEKSDSLHAVVTSSIFIVGRYLLWLILLFLILINSVAADDINMKTRVGTKPNGNQYCIECEKNLLDCECSCPDPKCSKVYRMIEASDGANFEQWKVSTTGCCQCHFEDSTYYCKTCCLRLELCACDESDASDSENTDNHRNFAQPPKKKPRVTFDIGDGLFVRLRSDKSLLQVPALEQMVPELENSGLELVPRLMTNTVGTSSFVQPEWNEPHDAISALLNPAYAQPVLADKAILMPTLNQLLAEFSVQPDSGQTQQILLQAAQYVGNAFPVDQNISGEIEIQDPALLLHVLLINDKGTLRLVLVFSRGNERLLVFRNIHGLIETHITNYQGLQTFNYMMASTANPDTLNNLFALGLATLVLQQPVANMDDLWAAATKAWRKAHPESDSRQTVIRSSYEKTTRKRQGGIVIRDRKSVSDKLRTLFESQIKRSSCAESHEFSPTIAVVNIEQEALSVGHTVMAASETTTFSISNHNFDFVNSFTSDQWLTVLEGNTNFAFVISEQGSADYPLIIFVSLGHFVSGVTVDLINILSFNSNNASFNVSQTIPLPQGGFLQLLKDVIARINNDYLIRFFELRTPSDEE